MSQTERSRSLGAAIKARRLELGWSQEELAERVAARGDAAFRQSDVSRLELGKVGLPHRERLGRLAAVLDLTPGELLARSGWAGADAAFAREEPRTSPADPAPAPGPVWGEPLPPFAAPTPLAPSPPIRQIEELERLGVAIAEAEATRARARQILARSESLRDLFEHPQRTPPAG